MWVRQLAGELEQAGHPVAGLLARAGIRPRDIAAETGRIPFARHAAFFDIAAEATGNGCLGLRFGQSRDTRDAGLIGYVGLNSPVLLDALRNLARYRQVFSDAVELHADDLEGDGRVRWAFRGIGAAEARQSIEFSATNFVRAIRDLTGARISPLALSFAHPRNEDVGAFDAFFGCEVRFGAGVNVMTLNPADLARPIRTADDRLLAVLQRACTEALSRHDRRPPPLVEQVENIVTARLGEGGIRIATVAADCGMSTRSLTRRLAELGTSFSEIVDRLRHDLAVRYLNETAISLTEIAFLLGYGEVSSFNHAFRRWTGQTPSAVRGTRRR